MSSGELLLTILVALIVFGPNKLPMLADHLGQLYRHIIIVKRKAMAFCETQINQYQLDINQRRAQEADAVYQTLECAQPEVDDLPISKK